MEEIIFIIIQKMILGYATLALVLPAYGFMYGLWELRLRKILNFGTRKGKNHFIVKMTNVSGAANYSGLLVTQRTYQSRGNEITGIFNVYLDMAHARDRCGVPLYVLFQGCTSKTFIPQIKRPSHLSAEIEPATVRG